LVESNQGNFECFQVSYIVGSVSQTAAKSRDIPSYDDFKSALVRISKEALHFGPLVHAGTRFTGVLVHMVLRKFPTFTLAVFLDFHFLLFKTDFVWFGL
jgi:hypothetical protein